DASVREWQFHAKQIASGKNFEGTGAFGPWMVTADEIAPGRELKLQTRLNGEVVQSSHTGHMIFPIPRLISYASTIFTLVPGDVMGKSLGHPLIVDPQPGAGGTLASGSVARARPDGYTLLLATGGHAVAAAMMDKLAYDPVRGFQPVSTVTYFPFLLVVRADS